MLAIMGPAEEWQIGNRKIEKRKASSACKPSSGLDNPCSGVSGKIGPRGSSLLRGETRTMRIVELIKRAIVPSFMLAVANGSAQAQSFNQFIGFGDSSIDSGFYRALPNPGGGTNFNL